jgi:hypothetical protein
MGGATLPMYTAAYAERPPVALTEGVVQGADHTGQRILLVSFTSASSAVSESNSTSSIPT